MKHLNGSVTLSALLLLLLPPSLRAQAVSGTILGSVQDSSGASVPGASVTITNSETGLTRVVTTDAAGEFNAPSLPPGMYNVAAEIRGFKKVSFAATVQGPEKRTGQ